MGFWDAYFRSLKPLEVEEPIDVWVHRPPAYVLARILLPTPVSPNAVTFGSIFARLRRGRGDLQFRPSAARGRADLLLRRAGLL